MSPFDPLAEQGALAVPSDLGTLVITGKDRLTWLNGLVTCDLARLEAPRGAYGLSTSKVGRILADVVVVAGETSLLVGVPRDRAAALRETFDAYLVMEDAEIADGSAEHAWIFLHGRSAAALSASAPGVRGIVDFTGLGGAAVVVPASKRDEAMSALVAAGATAGDDADWNALRIERAVARYGVDFDEKTYPQEASLERRAVSFQKGCYLGQEVVCRLEMRGHVHRKLVALTLDGDAPLASTEVTAAGEAIGQITSAATSPRLGRAVALAMVKHAHSGVGTHLAVGGRDAQVVEVPLVVRRDG